MNPSARHHLLEESLLPGEMAESLAATRRAARHRRLRRRSARAGMLACVALAAGWFLRQRGETSLEAPVVSATPTPSFVLITTASAEAPAIVLSGPAPSSLIVSTRDTAGVTPRASEDDLFALAGSRPAALHRLSDGSARWMWLDEKRPF